MYSRVYLTAFEHQSAKSFPNISSIRIFLKSMWRQVCVWSASDRAIRQKMKQQVVCILKPACSRLCAACVGQFSDLDCTTPCFYLVQSLIYQSRWLNLTGGPYAAFGGKDASRGLATFSVTASEVEYDDLSDLSPPEMDSVREWEAQFKGERWTRN